LEANLAVLIDFENIAAGTEKEGLGRFDVEALLKRLKDKGRILVARSYADWGRFARFKQTLLSSNVTMMELTSHGMQDKNRADIAMVVDCLELAFTKDYLDTFVVVSGDSDFTPLVLKMRELNKRVIGCGTRASTSRLLIQACDEFMFYDTVIKEARAPRAVSHQPAASGEQVSDEQWFAIVVDTLAGIQRENPEPCLASIVKTALLRKNPDFDEVELGYSSFARFLEAAQEAGHVRLSRDNKSGGYRVDQPDGADDDDGGPSDDSRDDHPAKEWIDPYVPAAAAEHMRILAAKGISPLGFATRMTILQLIEQNVSERRKRRRRITLGFVQDDIIKRLKRSHPDIPASAVKGLFDSLLKAGLLVHKDGKAIRTPSAPFVLDHDAEGLNRALMGMWLRELKTTNADLGDSEALAELFLGHRERKREVEEMVAWSAVAEADDLDIDNVLLDDDSTVEAVLTEDVTAPSDSASEPEAPSAAEADNSSLDDALSVDEAPAEDAPVAAEDGAEDAEKPRRRRRTRVRRGKKDDDAPAGDAPIDDIDTLLAVDSADES